MNSSLKKLIGMLLLAFGCLITIWHILSSDVSPTVVTEQKRLRDIELSSSTYLRTQHKLSGTFTAQHNYLGIVSIPLSSEGIRTDDTLIFRIKERGTEKWYSEGDYGAVWVTKNSEFPFGFAPIYESKGKEFQFEIESRAGVENNAVKVENASEFISVKYQYPKSALLKDPMQLAQFIWGKTLPQLIHINFYLSLLLYFLPFILYIRKTIRRMIQDRIHLPKSIQSLRTYRLFDQFTAEEILLCIGVCTISAGIVLRDFITNKSLFLLPVHDFFSNLLPNYIHIGELIRKGEFPLWSFSVGLGTNVFAGNFMRVSILDPFTWITYFFDASQIIGVFPYLLFAKLILAGVFFYIYLRSNSISHVTAIIFSVFYMLCGEMVMRLPWFHYTTEMVLIPLLLLSVDAFVLKKKNVPILLCFVWLAGFHIYHVLLYSVFSVGYILLVHFLHIDNKQSTAIDRAKDVLRIGIRFSKNLIVAILIAAPLFGPNLYNYLHSARFVATESSDSFYAVNSVFVNFKLFIVILFSFFGQGITGTLGDYTGWSNSLEDPSIYAGLIPLIFFITYPFYFPKKRKLFLAISLMILVYLFVPAVRNVVNVLYENRFKTSSFIVPLVILILGALSFDKYLNSDRHNKLIGVVSFVLLFLLIGISGFVTYLQTDLEIIVNTQAFITLSIVLVCVSIAPLLKKSHAVILLIIIPFPAHVFLSTEYLHHGKWLDQTYLNRHNHIQEITSEITRKITKKDTSFFGIENRLTIFDVGSNDSTGLGYPGFAAYQSFNEASLQRFITFWGLENDKGLGSRYFAGIPLERDYLSDMLIMKYLLVSDTSINLPDSFEYVSTYRGIHVYENPHVTPFGSIFTQFMTYENFQKVQESSYDNFLKSVILVDPDERVNLIQHIDETTKPEQFAENSKSMQFLKNTAVNNTEITGEYDLVTGGVALFQFPYNEGWRLEIDGETSKLFAVNGGLTGAVIPSGEHQIRLSYSQPYLMEGLIISLVTIGSILLGRMNEKRFKYHIKKL